MLEEAEDKAARAAVEGRQLRTGVIRWLPKPYNDNMPIATQPARKGDWLQTFTGRQFWPMDPRADEIFIEDIAHSLSMQCRFAGHCKRFYSVAEHSILLSRQMPEKFKLWALLHDASEAYLVDVPRTVKPFLPGYKQAENAVMAAICERFGLVNEMPTELKAADRAIIGDERSNMAPCVAEWYSTGPGIGARLQYWSPEKAESTFLHEFSKLVAGSPAGEAHEQH
ncbi:hypothetical protein [Ochrobactrum sp. MYb379]|uniref:hypothetical protein n=1 Tax=Ochrobactrum sp. MYb379 TaxID=2745275 RepID=UPI0030AB4330